MATVLVIGASRGIGRGLVHACLARGDRVIATVRSRNDAQALRAAGAEVLVVDVAQTASASTPPTQQDFDRVMHTNVLGAMQVLPQVMPCVQAAEGVMVCISSMMSRLSLADSRAWLYRTSKAALNMVVASAQTQWPDCRILAMDPGWVQTDMGGDGAQISVADCVQNMLQTVAQSTSEDGGRLLRHDGERLLTW